MDQTGFAFENVGRLAADSRMTSPQEIKLNQKSTPYWFVFLLLMLAMPFVIGLIWYGLYQVAEGRAAQRLEPIYSDIDSSPSRALDRMTKKRLDENTSRQYTPKLEKLETLANSLISSYPNSKLIPFLSNGVKIPSLAENGSWPYEPVTVGFLEMANPLFLLADQIAQSPTKIWVPNSPVRSQYALAWTHNNMFRSIQELEIHYSLYKRDIDRAWAGLERLQGVNRAKHGFESQVGFDHSIVLRSLQANLWDESQLENLKSSFIYDRPENPLLDSEQLRIEKLRLLYNLGYDEGGRNQFSIFSPSLSAQKTEKVLALYDISIARSLSSAGSIIKIPNKLLTESEIKERGFDPIRLEKLFDNFLIGMRPTYNRIQSKDFERLARTAFTIKEYHLKFGDWPSELKDLGKLGLTVEDWSTLAGYPFGFRQQDDSILLWRYKTSYGGRLKGYMFLQGPPPIDPPAASEPGTWPRQLVEIR